MTPYYSDESVTIYHGDCREMLPHLQAEMLFTDPPYGVDYTGGHFHSGDVNIKRERERLGGDTGTKLYTDLFGMVRGVIDGPCYIWFAGTKAHDVYGAALGCDMEIHALIVWHKTNATYAAMNSQYKQRTEFCLYCKPKGSTLRWCGPTNEVTLWELRRDAENDLHPTQKPVSLATRAIGNHKADVILDPFMGSGSTLRAAKDLGRLELLRNFGDILNVRCSRYQQRMTSLSRYSRLTLGNCSKDHLPMTLLNQ